MFPVTDKTFHPSQDVQRFMRGAIETHEDTRTCLINKTACISKDAIGNSWSLIVFIKIQCLL